MDSFKNNLKNVPYTDGDENLSLYCSERGKGSLFQRGIFVDNTTGKVVMRGSPYPIELVDGNLPRNLECMLNLRRSKVYQSCEGTVIMVFFHNNKWYTATNKKLDAHKSWWACSNQKFGDVFTSRLRRLPECHHIGIEDNGDFLNQVYEENLRKDWKYIFLQPPTYEERIVCTNTDHNPKVIAILDENLKNVEGDCENRLIKRLMPVELMLKTVPALLNYIRRESPWESQGVVVIRDDGTHFKVYNGDYWYLSCLRNNVASINFRYLQLRGTPRVSELLNLYPEIPVDRLEHEIQILVHRLHELYMAKYVRKEMGAPPEGGALRVPIPKEYNRLLVKLQNIHYDYKIKIYPRQVELMLLEEDTLLNRALKRLRVELKNEVVESEPEELEESENVQEVLDLMDKIRDLA